MAQMKPPPERLVRKAQKLEKQGDLEEAARIVARMLKKAPDHRDLLVWLGNLLIQTGKAEGADKAYRRVRGLGVETTDILNNHAAALRALKRYDEAVEIQRRSVALAPGFRLFRVNLANSLRDAGRLREAVEEFEAIVHDEPDYVLAWTQMAALYQLLGQAEKARDTALKALEFEPDNAVAFKTLGSVAMVLKNFDPDLIRRFEKNLKEGNVEDSKAAPIHHSLSEIYNSQEDWDKAFIHCAAHNSISRQQWRDEGIKYHPDDFDAFIDELSGVFNRDLFDDFSKKRRIGSKSAMPIFIVGMPRSGTTLVETILAKNGQIEDGGEREDIGKIAEAVNDYPSGVKLLPKTALIRMAAQYINDFGPVLPVVKRITDKMPHNFLHLGLIAILFPNARIIYCRRNPIDNCLSIFMQSFKSGHSYATDLADIAHQYKAHERLMAHWKKVLPLPVLDLPYEEHVQNPEEWKKTLIDFMELEGSDGMKLAGDEQGGDLRIVKTASQMQVTRKINTGAVARWKRYQAHLGPLMEAFPDYAE